MLSIFDFIAGVGFAWFVYTVATDTIKKFNVQYIFIDTLKKNEEYLKILVKTLDNNPLPAKKTDGSIGFDIYAIDDYVIPPGGGRLIRSGIFLQMPKGIYANIRQKSRHFQHRILLNSGLIDSDYRGEILIKIHNLGIEPFYIKKGEEIAQLEFVRSPNVVLVSGNVDPTETVRGNTGFGGVDTSKLK